MASFGYFILFYFFQAFTDIVVRDSELVTVELVASDREGGLQGVVFLGSIRFEQLKKVYDARVGIDSMFVTSLQL